MSNIPKYKTYDILDDYSFLIEKSKYKEFLDEWESVLTAAKLIGYNVIIRKVNCGVEVRFNDNPKKIYCRFSTTWTGLICEIEIGVGEIHVKNIVNHQFPEDLIKSIKILKINL